MDRCYAAQQNKIGGWVENFPEVLPASKLNASRSGFATFQKKTPHPVVLLLRKGLLRSDEKYVTFLFQNRPTFDQILLIGKLPLFKIRV